MANVNVVLRNPKSATMAMVLDAALRKIDSGKWSIERTIRVIQNISDSRGLKMRYTPGYIGQHRRYREEGHNVRAPRPIIIRTVA